MTDEPSKLLDFIDKYYSLEEFRTICFKFGLPYDNLQGEGLIAKKRELILYAWRQERLSDLLDLLREKRPDLFSQTGLSKNPVALNEAFSNAYATANVASVPPFTGRNVTQEAEKTNDGVEVFLPRKTYHRLIGRYDQLQEVMNALREPERKPIVMVAGIGGIGKTALAREAVQLIKTEHAFDFVVWSSFKTEYFSGEQFIDPSLETASIERFYEHDLLNDIGRQCNRPDIAEMNVQQKQEVVRYLLSAKRVCIIVDNLETVPRAEQLVANAFQILGVSKLLITSRHEIRNEGVYTIRLRGLSEEASLTLLLEESKERGIGAIARATRSDLKRVHRAAGGAPLAIKLLVGQMSRQPLETVLDELVNVSRTGQDYSFYRFVFRQSWDLLTFEAQQVLVSMSVFSPGSGGTEAMVRDVSGLERSVFLSALDQLVLMSLVESLGDIDDRRYSIHQLTSHFIHSDIVKDWGEAADE